MASPTKPRWSSERILASPIYWTIVTDERQFPHVLKDIYHPEKPPPRDWFTDTTAPGITHAFSSSDGGLFCVVCIRGMEEHDPLSVVSLIAHEAVHIWQDVREYLSEEHPSIEFEAYSVQIILQQLLHEYRRQMYGV